MLASRRSALLVFAAASASSVAPAQVLPAAAEAPVAEASLSVPVPDLLDPQGEPRLSDETPDTIVPEQPSASATSPSGSLGDLVAQLRSSQAGSRELECLAIGVYFEARSEPLAGQLAVGEVIANRARSGRFPSTYCGVLFQRSQFSFVRGGRLPAVPGASRQWQNAVAIARIVDQDLTSSTASKALFFHAKRVSPGWRLKRVASIGNHIFYR